MSETISFGERAIGVDYVDRPAAYAVILDAQGRVGVVRGRRGWFLPGGGSDPGETPDETLAREAREEIAREIEVIQLLGEVTQFFSVADTHYRLIATIYVAELAAPIDAHPEYTLEWVSIDEARGEFFHECHVWAVKRGLELTKRRPAEP